MWWRMSAQEPGWRLGDNFIAVLTLRVEAESGSCCRRSHHQSVPTTTICNQRLRGGRRWRSAMTRRGINLVCVKYYLIPWRWTAWRNWCQRSSRTICSSIIPVSGTLRRWSGKLSIIWKPRQEIECRSAPTSASRQGAHQQGLHPWTSTVWFELSPTSTAWPARAKGLGKQQVAPTRWLSDLTAHATIVGSLGIGVATVGLVPQGAKALVELHRDQRARAPTRRTTTSSLESAITAERWGTRRPSVGLWLGKERVATRATTIALPRTMPTAWRVTQNPNLLVPMVWIFALWRSFALWRRWGADQLPHQECLQSDLWALQQVQGLDKRQDPKRLLGSSLRQWRLKRRRRKRGQDQGQVTHQWCQKPHPLMT